MKSMEMMVMGGGCGREDWMESLFKVNVCCKVKSGLMVC